ncbi:MAG TPA: DinB family protein [Acidobacteriaceae bacterium]|jgi:hypothetical protein
MSESQQFSAAVLQSWTSILERTGKTFASFSDADLQREVAPGKNRVYYLLGHLTAVHDRLLSLLRVGDRLHPELDEEFLSKPDRSFPDENVKPEDLRKAWSEVNAALLPALESLTPSQWLERHASVSEEDFAKEPHRNRLAVLLSRTNHCAYHEGQVRLAK